MDVPFYISELLYKHDCVILPDFGGFVTQYAPAKIHPVSHTFYPPSKTVMFNSKLNRDDGLLIDFISAKENTDYEKARQKVAAYVEGIRERLNNGEKAVLKHIGTLKKDIEGKILFNPSDDVNYLEDSFGLTSFVSLPVIRKPIHKRIEKKFTDRKPKPAEERKNRKVYWALLAIVPVLFLTGWFIFFNNNPNGNNMQQSGMVDLNEQTTTEPVDKTSDARTEDNNGPPLKSLDFNENKAEKEAPRQLPKSNTIPSVQKLYYIIGGAFSHEENAEKLIGLLRNKGYEAEHAGLSKSGLHMVSYFVTEDKNEALVNLTMIRKNDNPNAWLLHK